ncbi:MULTISPECIES: hypothetical protein [Laceyella]|jgi:hypothetical protein|uniref:Small acid-soluble spore protein P (Minor) n=1 Tax=Laceyella sediminis TaxID=573074 RepID=A0ABX5ELW2_9BACL|nr:hypothetical protein [Laceyella sediminis]MRG28681.1 hypothetical protein [Laceyella tengchongensis]PRZ13027.1 hypothetical protein CLV36_11074 [Laceyella sediminis]
MRHQTDERSLEQRQKERKNRQSSPEQPTVGPTHAGNKKLTGPDRPST